MTSSAGQLNETFHQTNCEVQAANVQMSAYIKQNDALNQHTADMQKSADLQRLDFEKKLRNFDMNKQR